MLTPSWDFARSRPASWLWLNDLSLNLPTSLISAAVKVARGAAALPPTRPPDTMTAAATPMSNGRFTNPSLSGAAIP